MNHRQQRFVAEYLVDGNGAQAALRAGYSRGSARSDHPYTLLANPEVAAAVRAGQKALAEQTGRTALEVLKEIQEVTQEARAAGDWRTALKGLELEGKHLGLFSDRLEHVGEITIRLPEPREAVIIEDIRFEAWRPEALPEDLSKDLSGELAGQPKVLA